MITQIIKSALCFILFLFFIQLIIGNLYSNKTNSFNFNQKSVDFSLLEDSNMETSSFITEKNMEEDFSFYKFNTLKYKEQIGTLWCWASCLSQMIKGLDSNSIIGETQCNLVQHYGRNYKKNNEFILSSNDNCCEQNNSKCFKVSIDPKHVEDIFYQAGFNSEPIETPNVDLKNYDFIRNTLIENDSPIILNIYTNRPHLVMIAGFGEKNNINYVLVSDPDGKKEENYYPINCFINQYLQHVDHAWTTKLKSPRSSNKNLDIDFEFKQIYLGLKASILKEKNKNSINWNDKFDDPLFFLKAYGTLKKPIGLNDNFNEKVKERKELIVNLVQSNNTNCDVNNIRRSQFLGNNTGDVRNLKKFLEQIIQKDYNFNIEPYNRIYLPEYLMTVEQRVNSNQKRYIKPVFFPSDYDIKTEWLEIEEFNKVLEGISKMERN